MFETDSVLLTVLLINCGSDICSRGAGTGLRLVLLLVCGCLTSLVLFDFNLQSSDFCTPFGLGGGGLVGGRGFVFGEALGLSFKSG